MTQAVTQRELPGKSEGQLPTELAMYAQVIKDAARDPNVDVVKLEKLLDMQERIMTRNAELAFNEAMTKAQSAMTMIAADAMNPQTRSRYATYKALDKVLRPIYTTNGFALSFGTGDSPLPEHVRVVCDAAHVQGHRRAYSIDIPADGKGAKGGDVMTKTHAVGAGVSYGMRYLLKMIFNVAVGEDDNDGNEVVPTVSKEQEANIKALIDEIGGDTQQKFLAYYKVKKLSDLGAHHYDNALKALQKKRQGAK